MCIFVHAAVIQPPESQVAFPGTVVNYVCQGDDTIAIVLNDSLTGDEYQAGDYFLDKGVNFMLDSRGDIYVYNITINASMLNNGTSFFCLDNNGKSTKVYLYTVEGKAQNFKEQSMFKEKHIGVDI